MQIDHRVETPVLGRPGSDLLFQALRLSTIGAVEFNGRVRDGNGFRLHARTTRPAKDGVSKRERSERPGLDPGPRAASCGLSLSVLSIRPPSFETRGLAAALLRTRSRNGHWK